MPKSVHVTLVSTYDLGHQPFGLASPAAWLKNAGIEVRCVDIAVQPFDPAYFEKTDVVAFHLPMHTATRLAQLYAPKVKAINPLTKLVFYGLYAATNSDELLALGADYIFGGEYETDLTKMCLALAGGTTEEIKSFSINLSKQEFCKPERTGLPALKQYAHLHIDPSRRMIAGYTEASRGCKYTCRHCPVVPVYKGRFRIIQPEVVQADIRQQVAAGAEHITFGDPDFLNGPRHAEKIVRNLHAEFPQISYDITVKVEHILRYPKIFNLFQKTGCRFITCAVESFDDRVLNIVQKGHSREDIFSALRILDDAAISVSPTFIPFTPWTSISSYLEMLEILMEYGLVENVASIQLAIRLLITNGSALLGAEGLERVLQPFDRQQLIYPWKHEDPAVDTLQTAVMRCVEQGVASAVSRPEIFNRVYSLVAAAAEKPVKKAPQVKRRSRSAVPYLSEPWYC